MSISLFQFGFEIDVRVSLDGQLTTDQRGAESTTHHISLNYEKFSLMMFDYLIQDAVREIVQL